MCQIFITVWVQKERVGFTTYNNEPIQDFGPKFRGEVLCRTLGQISGGGCYARLWAKIQGGGAMQDFGPNFRGGGMLCRTLGRRFFLGGADATQCAFTRHFMVHVKQCQYMLLFIIILHKNMVSVIQHGSGHKLVG